MSAHRNSRKRPLYCSTPSRLQCYVHPSFVQGSTESIPWAMCLLHEPPHRSCCCLASCPALLEQTLVESQQDTRGLASWEHRFCCSNGEKYQVPTCARVQAGRALHRVRMGWGGSHKLDCPGGKVSIRGNRVGTMTPMFCGWSPLGELACGQVPQVRTGGCEIDFSIEKCTEWQQ